MERVLFGPYSGNSCKKYVKTKFWLRNDGTLKQRQKTCKFQEHFLKMQTKCNTNIKIRNLIQFLIQI